MKNNFFSVVLRAAVVFCALSSAASAAAQQCGSWVSLNPQTVPTARLRHVLVYDPVIAKAVLFGGTAVISSGGVQTFAALGDTWLWDSLSQNWQGPLTLPAAPQARYGSAAAYDEQRQEIVLFGGADGSNNQLADTWIFNGAQWLPVPTPVAPPARVFHSMAYNAVLHQVVVFGGLSGTALVQDVWAFDGAQWSKLMDGGPSSRELASFSYDATLQRNVLFGGFQSTGYLGDTWEFDLATWINLQVSSPTARIEAPMTYEPLLKRDVLFSGLEQNGTLLNDTWEWDGSAWTQFQQPAGLPLPPPRRGAQTTYDSQLSGLLMFGGTDATARLFNDTWLFSVPDSDKDGVPDCVDQCPLDSSKTAPGVCGCNVPDTVPCGTPTTTTTTTTVTTTTLGGGGVVDLAAVNPLAPALSMNGKAVHVVIPPAPGANYKVTFYQYKKPTKKSKPPKTVTFITGSPVIDIPNLAKNKIYVVSYVYVSAAVPSIQSQQSPSAFIVVKPVKVPKSKKLPGG